MDNSANFETAADIETTNGIIYGDIARSNLTMDFTNVNSLTSAQIMKLVKWHKENKLPRYVYLENYYDGQNEKIMLRKMEDKTKPNNKIVNNYPQYIVDTAQGFFMGKPVAYNYPDDKTDDLFSAILKKNNETAHNATLSLYNGIYGDAFELHYMNENSEPCFDAINPKEFLPIYTNKIRPTIGLGIRHFNDVDPFTNKTTLNVELYWPDRTEYYKKVGNTLVLQETETKPNPFGKVNVVHFRNNEKCFGDFERIITLIDDYDLRISDHSNEQDFSRNAYLLLSGFDMTNPENQALFKKMKELGAFGLPEGADIKYLIKELNDTFGQNHLTEIKKNIHKFSMIPDLSDEQFAGNLSGVALGYKLWGLEQLAGKKEQQFKKGLMDRFELLATVLKIKNKETSIANIEINFTRNIPQNVKEIVETIVALKSANLIDDEKLVAQLPFIDDPSKAVEDMQKQKDTNIENTKKLTGTTTGNTQGNATTQTEE